MILITALPMLLSKRAPINLDTLVKRSLIIVRVRPSKDVTRPIVTDVITGSTLRGTAIQLKKSELNADPPRPDERGSMMVSNECILFLRPCQTSDDRSVLYQGAEVRIPLDRGSVDVRIEELGFEPSPVLLIGPQVYARLPVRHAHVSWMSYRELRSYIISRRRIIGTTG